MNAQEKTPLEISPMHFKLDRYGAPVTVACGAADGQTCGPEAPDTGTGTEGKPSDPPQR